MKEEEERAEGWLLLLPDLALYMLLLMEGAEGAQQGSYHSCGCYVPGWRYGVGIEHYRGHVGG